MDGSSVATILVESMNGQSETLTTLALAICAGIVALLLQIAIHNRSDGTKAIRLCIGDLLFVAFVLEGASVVAAYLVRGAIVSSIPELVSLKYAAQGPLSPDASTGLQAIHSLGQVQFALFGLGVLAILVVLVANRSLFRHE
ncbi:hypothetical protein [Dongia sp.]|uniref:hypothetical protein n=1 Tax=Dongia sp. TaxID=1977262 RepID=UPI003753A21E